MQHGLVQCILVRQAKQELYISQEGTARDKEAQSRSHNRAALFYTFCCLYKPDAPTEQHLRTFLNQIRCPTLASVGHLMSNHFPFNNPSSAK
ncbi:hypothetical protein QTN47_25550 [Danxiaibacter flavus]|uniref:Uncharacterized protein n=1 Tax=Danxiaibacter flavus TaxID=3049108 RepID=A0ABV3ZN31_9BACT|nr:hypothetical protein QNM32_25550 [Chitinophagaceae bacterium DXS]